MYYTAWLWLREHTGPMGSVPEESPAQRRQRVTGVTSEHLTIILPSTVHRLTHIIHITYIHTYTTYIHTYIHTYIETYIHIYTHAYIHTYVLYLNLLNRKLL